MGASGPVAATIIGQSYASLSRNHFIPALQQRGCVNQIIFMQDGAPPHIAHPVKQLLKRPLGNARIIGHYFPSAYPIRLWG